MIVMFMYSDASTAQIIIMTHALIPYLSMLSPLQIGGDIIYVLICSLTDPVSNEPIPEACLCEPLLPDDGRGIEDLDEGKPIGTRTGTPFDYESLLGVCASKVPGWRRRVCWPRLRSTRH